jgi:hypothetical protein
MTVDEIKFTGNHRKKHLTKAPTTKNPFIDCDRISRRPSKIQYLKSGTTPSRNPATCAKIERVSWDESKVFINLSRDTIKQSPDYTKNHIKMSEYAHAGPAPQNAIGNGGCRAVKVPIQAHPGMEPRKRGTNE